MQLHAHICFEDEEKKGGNNVACLICGQLFYDGFLQADKKHVKELNFVIHNCSGQNKNHNSAANAAPSCEKEGQ